MNLNSAALKLMVSKGLTLQDVADIVEANEQTRDPTAAERMRRMRAKKKGGSVTRNVTPEPPNDNILTPGSEAKASSPYIAPPGVPDETWADFLKSPKRKKAGMSQTAYAGICNNLNELAEHGYPPGAMVALAVERGWTTVKLEWVQNDKRNNSMGRHQPADGLSSTARAAVAVFGLGTRQQ